MTKRIDIHYECDICKTSMNLERGHKLFYRRIDGMFDRIGKLKHYDLCDKCFRKIQNEMLNKRNNKDNELIKDFYWIINNCGLNGEQYMCGVCENNVYDNRSACENCEFYKREKKIIEVLKNN